MLYGTKGILRIYDDPAYSLKLITAGGIYGTVKEIKETTLLIEVDGNVTLRVDKNMVVADTTDLQK